MKPIARNDMLLRAVTRGRTDHFDSIFDDREFLSGANLQVPVFFSRGSRAHSLLTAPLFFNQSTASLQWPHSAEQQTVK